MVGIVIISHSPTLAEGAAEVARAMGIGKAVVEPAGGDTEGGSAPASTSSSAPSPPRTAATASC
ncbi:hypothetical protein [Actinomadura madurae]|uniref:hypothetical protein n=1 Tax=Actinomadura madurae TaxID=1993 RepID=UPI0020D25371|nr:hypothetical protein [Actinomadura madurae]MCQ0018581.1 hypothetical protein [Actinomadura madurae]